MKLTITGHRPKSLYGYNLNDPRYMMIRDRIREFVLGKKCTDFYTGMALGVDQLGALEVIDLKAKGCGIKLHAAIPCQGHSSKWPEASRRLYDAILSKCDTVTLVTDAPYSPRLMQERNIWMVDRADEVLAVYDEGRAGGTKNCIDYALSMSKPVWVVPPFNPFATGYLGAQA